MQVFVFLLSQFLKTDRCVVFFFDAGGYGGGSGNGGYGRSGRF